MTRQARSPGHKPRTTAGGKHDSLNTLTRDGAGVGEEARVKATLYLVRTGNADLLPILGLVEDPVAVAKGRAKALADMSGRRLREPKEEL